MSTLDWSVMVATLVAMIGYGLHKSRGQDGAYSYLLADRQLPWYVVLLGVMATQASAITFLSAPGQAYTDGMRFVQYYFGLPVAMVVICIVFIPIFRRLDVYTAYEYLEQRFDRRTRLLASLLFLLSRGLSTGISIYAPAIILSSILGWNIYLTNVVTGGLLLVYTYVGGAKAVAHTQKLQFTIILVSMVVAGMLLVHHLPPGISISNALQVAGKAGKLNAITTHFDWKDKYNIWSGLIGGFFLALSYFGTDQSQVGRYMTARDTHESRIGLLLNGLVKIPMQFGILLLGALVFAFYSFRPAPAYFNDAAYSALKAGDARLGALDARYNQLHHEYETLAASLAAQQQPTEMMLRQFREKQAGVQQIRDSVATLVNSHHLSPDKNDTNYIFLYFVKSELPKGIVGLLFAVIILASWGSISAALNSLAASSLMDVQMAGKHDVPPAKQLRYGRLHTLGWGLLCICIAMFAARLGSLIEAVNVLGSLFYGTILGIFLVAFFMKKVDGNSVFVAALITEVAVVVIYVMDIVSFLWLNVAGALLVMLIGYFLSLMRTDRVNSI
jgi:solute:Na+ symporter, SSS family